MRISSERWGPNGAQAEAEAVLAARVRSVRGLWAPRAPPALPSVSRKMRTRRKPPRRLTLAAPPPAYCLEVPAHLLCDPACKLQFDPPRPPQLTECQRAMGRLSANIQAVIRASAARCPPYRAINASRYSPTGPRPARCQDRRYGIGWPKDHTSPRLAQISNIAATINIAHKPIVTTEPEEVKVKDEEVRDPPDKETDKQTVTANEQQTLLPEKSEGPNPQNKVPDDQMPSTSAAAMLTDLRQRRLYSTVLSMSAPVPITLNPVVRLAQKLATPALLKLNPKIVPPGVRIRPPTVDHKFEELEKEALEQYKASDESIDTKFHELEKQAVEQYSNSNSNTSCSSGNSVEKRTSISPTESDTKTKQPAKFHKEKPVDVVVSSQNFPDLNSKSQTSSEMNLKNFHTPPRGEKKEQPHRPSKNMRCVKSESQRAASDTDYEAREISKVSHKGPPRWTYVVPPKKRHLTMSTDFSSDEDVQDTSVKDAGLCIKNHVSGKIKMSAHGGGDLNPIMRKT